MGLSAFIVAKYRQKFKIIAMFLVSLKNGYFVPPQSRKEHFWVRDILKFEEPYKILITSLLILLDCQIFHHGLTFLPNTFENLLSRGSGTIKVNIKYKKIYSRQGQWFIQPKILLCQWHHVLAGYTNFQSVSVTPLHLFQLPAQLCTLPLCIQPRFPSPEKIGP